MMLQILQVIWHCLMYCNSCVNPFIYNYASKDFRDGFRDVMWRWGLIRSAGTGTTSDQATTRPPGDTTGTGGQRPRADGEDANNEGDNEMMEHGGVYCGPSVDIQLNPRSPNPTYV